MPTPGITWFPSLAKPRQVPASGGALTWDPATINAYTALSNSDLTATGTDQTASNGGAALGSIGHNANVLYFELEVTTSFVPPYSWMGGVAISTWDQLNLQIGVSETGVYSPEWDSGNPLWGSALANGSILGFKIDFTARTADLIGADGTVYPALWSFDDPDIYPPGSLPVGVTLYPAISLFTFGPPLTASTINGGPTFAHGLPAGATAWGGSGGGGPTYDQGGLTWFPSLPEPTVILPTPTPPPVSPDHILLETGDDILTEDGSLILLE
jgi:hypothetical protein